MKKFFVLDVVLIKYNPYNANVNAEVNVYNDINYLYNKPCIAPQSLHLHITLNGLFISIVCPFKTFFFSI